MSGLFASGGHSFEVSASVLPMNIQGIFTLKLTGLISLLSWGLSKVFSSTTIQKHQLIPQHSAFFMVQFSHPYTNTGKTIALIMWIFVGKVVSLLFNMLSRLVTGAFLVDQW